MLTFDNRPPADDSGPGYRLIRTPPAHPLIAHVLSDNLIGCRTHYYNNRTVPCETPECEACASKIGWRWHGYLAILIDATRETAIFECTARASTAFADYYQLHRTTRGCHFKAVRLHQRTNGRVVIQCQPADPAKINLPAAPDLPTHLSHIWNIAPNQVTKPAQKPRAPFDNLSVDRSRAELKTAHQVVTDATDELLRHPPDDSNHKHRKPK